PCDVGVFGPLASSWKSEVMKVAQKFQKITKYNLLVHYANARRTAFTESTIKAAFRKTGIWPIDRSVIKESAFEPAMNTTTKSAQPVPTRVPTLLELITPSSVSSHSSIDSLSTSTTNLPNTPTQSSAPTPTPTPTPPLTPASARLINAEYSLTNLPPVLPATASRTALLKRNRQLEAYIREAEAQIKADLASKKLMDAENERLRQLLYAKQNKPKKQRVGGVGARHMTSLETLEALSYIDWKERMAIVHGELKGLSSFVEQRERCDDTWKDMMERERARLKAAADAEKAHLKAIADAERSRLKAIMDAEKAAEKARLKDLVEAEKARKKAAAELDKARKKAAAELERARKKSLADEEKERKKAEKAVAKKRRQKETHISDENASLDSPQTLSPAKRPRPIPRPLHGPRNLAQNVPEAHNQPYSVALQMQNVEEWPIDPSLC
ncbi:hypothetical protein C0992_010500, partial [Termitomyces sp. T32_za158]